MIIYLDSNFHCHVTDDGTRREIETDIFDDKCTTYIEGYRYIPAGESWVRSDGKVFHGIMIAPAEALAPLVKAQKQYEIDDADFTQQLGLLIDEIYSEDCGVID